MDINEARKKCPQIIACHVATLKDGENEPRYHDDPDSRTHKVRRWSLFTVSSISC
jgi:DNA polymerase eta